MSSITDIQQSGNEVTIAPYSPPPCSYKVYKRRWYVLAVYSALGFANNMISTTMSPIGPISERAFNLTQTDISLLANWFNVLFMITLVPYAMILQTKGLRRPIVSGAVFTTLGAAIRCLHVTVDGRTVFDKITFHLGVAINGIPAAVLWFGCTKISVVWFPPNERVISTTIALLAGPIGVAFNFLVGPYTVKYLAKNWAEVGEEPTLENYALAIRYLCYGEALICAALCALTLIYFPSEPPTPPSYTAKSQRFDFLPGVITFLKTRDAWLLVTLSSVTSAFLTGWTQFLSITMQSAMDEVESGWLGFAIIAVALVSGPITSLSSKWWLKIFPRLVPAAILSVGAISAVIFLIASAFVKSMMTPGLCWGTLTTASLFINACQPFYWEMACEAVYPVPEQIVSGMFCLVDTILSIVFYALYSIPMLGTAWTNWSLAISECLCVPIIFFYSGKTRRLAEDQRAMKENQTVPSGNDNPALIIEQL